MNLKLSIIVPCYNSQETLEDTIKSVFALNFKEWELLIVNDGSTDGTERVAHRYMKEDKRINYFYKDNGGLGTARNYGIERANGTYILPLDSDNKIRSHFPAKAIDIMENSNEFDIVYGNAQYFGEKTGIWRMGEFNKFRLLSYNYIDACAIIRKTVFEDIGLYEVEIPHQGHEDWELWIRALNGGKKFLYLDEITFDYRVSNDSMIKSFNKDMDYENEMFIKNKYSNLYIENFKPLFWQYEKYKKLANLGFYDKVKIRLKRLLKI